MTKTQCSQINNKIFLKILQEADGPFMWVIRGKFNKGMIYKGASGFLVQHPRGNTRKETLYLTVVDRIMSTSLPLKMSTF